jgi:hypothetical protein
MVHSAGHFFRGGDLRNSYHSQVRMPLRSMTASGLQESYDGLGRFKCRS